MTLTLAASNPRISRCRSTRCARFSNIVGYHMASPDSTASALAALQKAIVARGLAPYSHQAAELLWAETAGIPGHVD